MCFFRWDCKMQDYKRGLSLASLSRYLQGEGRTRRESRHEHGWRLSRERLAVCRPYYIYRETGRRRQGPSSPWCLPSCEARYTQVSCTPCKEFDAWLLSRGRCSEGSRPSPWRWLLACRVRLHNPFLGILDRSLVAGVVEVHLASWWACLEALDPTGECRWRLAKPFGSVEAPGRTLSSRDSLGSVTCRAESRRLH
jgi:hypothetical protein